MSLRTFLTAVFLLIAANAALAGARERIAALAPNALVFALDGNGKELVSQNADKPFVPASVTKVVTAWLAMETLGPDYRFETRFYIDADRVLYVRGGGDPFLISEEMAILAPELLKAAGQDSFRGMIIDPSHFRDDLRIPGIEATDEAYDALNVALAANFNTIHAVRKGNSVRSAEKQTPITPIAISQFRARGPNGRGRISLAQENPEIGMRYAGELIAAFIEQAGGKVEGEVRVGSLPDGLEPVYVHRQSRPLSEVIRLMLLGSNNFIANQVFLEVGAQVKGGQASLEKSLDVARDRLGAKGIAGVTLVEGSGISRDNRFTARGLAQLLHNFAPHAGLMKKTKAGSRYKTGTLSDVSTLAGYAATSSHGQVRFVIALPGRTGKLRFRLLQALEREL